MRSRDEVALDILPGPLETIGTVLRMARCKFNSLEASTSRCSCCINLKNYFSSDGAFFYKTIQLATISLNSISRKLPKDNLI